MADIDMIVCLLVAGGVIIIACLVVAIFGTRRGGVFCRMLKVVAGVVLATVAGMGWVLASIILELSLTGADWSGQSSTWVSRLVWRQAEPCGTVIYLIGIAFTLGCFFRGAKSPPPVTASADRIDGAGHCPPS